MTGDDVPIRQHLEALRRADQALHDERDRRYAGVNVEREKALRIKEEADKIALELAREIQTYKDQAHNGLLQQIDRERGRYPTKDDLAAVVEKLEARIEPLAKFASNQQVQSTTRGASWKLIAGIVGMAAGLAAVISVVLVLMSGGKT